MHWTLYFFAMMAAALGYYYMYMGGGDNFNAAMVANKRVLVTGASSGIGEQMAYHYCRMGARLVITARREESLKRVIKRCREIGSPDGDYHYVIGDMSDMAQTKTVVEGAVLKLGGLDFLVLNHVYDIRFQKWTGSEQNLTEFDRALDINMRAYVYLTSHAMPILQKSAGGIVVVSAGWGRVAPPFALAYTATKFGLEGYYHGLRQEFQLRDIPVSVTVCVLGLIGTEMAIERSDDMNAGVAFTPGKPSETALQIIKAGGRRDRELFFPWMPMRPMTLLRDFLTPILEWHWGRVLKPVVQRANAIM